MFIIWLKARWIFIIKNQLLGIVKILNFINNLKYFHTAFYWSIYWSIWWKTNVIFVILMSCLVGIDTKIAEKTSFNFHLFCRFPPLSCSHGGTWWKTNVIFVMLMLCLLWIDIKILKTNKKIWWFPSSDSLFCSTPLTTLK